MSLSFQTDKQLWADGSCKMFPACSNRLHSIRISEWISFCGNHNEWATMWYDHKIILHIGINKLWHEVTFKNTQNLKFKFFLWLSKNVLQRFSTKLHYIYSFTITRWRRWFAMHPANVDRCPYIFRLLCCIFPDLQPTTERPDNR